jgi:hypothetical protein
MRKNTASPLLAGVGGQIQATLLGVVAVTLLVFGFLMLLNTPAQAWMPRHVV